MSANFDVDNFMNFSEEDDSLWSLLSAYVDGETTAAESAIVEAHLHSDAAYAQDFAFLKAASRQVINLGDVEPPAQLREAIFAATVNKPNLIRRLAQAMGQFQAGFLPRYALPTGALAAGVVAAFLLMPKTADTKSDNASMESPTVAVMPSDPAMGVNKSVVTPPTKAIAPTINTDTQRKAAKNDAPPISLPNPQIDWAQMIAPSMRENIKAQKNIADMKRDAPKMRLIPVNSPSNPQSHSPKIENNVANSSSPMPKVNDMYNDMTFSRLPNMDRDNQRTIVVSDPPADPLPGEDVTPTTTAAAPPQDSAGENGGVKEPTQRTLRLRSGRTLPDSRRIATAAQFRSEESEFQKGMSRNTMLAIQRDELSGSTVTRF